MIGLLVVLKRVARTVFPSAARKNNFFLFLMLFSFSCARFFFF